MRVVVFGGTGMVGQGILRECLLAPDVTEVLSVVRSPTGRKDPKVREIAHKDFQDFTPIAGQLSNLDAAFWALGISSLGLSEADYTRITYDITVAAATVLAKMNPRMTFVFISGTGADSSEKGRVMWARVKGRAENAILAMPFKRAYVFRPGVIQPLHGIKSKTTLYRVFYDILGPLVTAARKVFPKAITTTEQIGRAMLSLARNGGTQRIYENADINLIR